VLFLYIRVLDFNDSSRTWRSFKKILKDNIDLFLKMMKIISFFIITSVSPCS